MVYCFLQVHKQKILADSDGNYSGLPYGMKNMSGTDPVNPIKHLTKIELTQGGGHGRAEILFSLFIFLLLFHAKANSFAGFWFFDKIVQNPDDFFNRFVMF